VVDRKVENIVTLWPWKNVKNERFLHDSIVVKITSNPGLKTVKKPAQNGAVDLVISLCSFQNAGHCALQQIFMRYYMRSHANK
jgi:hypothetical protein